MFFDNYLDFNVSYDFLTLYGQRIYPRSINETLFFNLKLESLDSNTFGPFDAYSIAQWNSSRFGLPAEYKGTYDFEYNMSKIPDGNYSLHLEEFNYLIKDNNSNYVTFRLINSEITNIQYTNLSFTFPLEQLTNLPGPISTSTTTTEPTSTSTLIISTSNSSAIDDSTTKSIENLTTDGFTTLILLSSICLALVFRTKRY